MCSATDLLREVTLNVCSRIQLKSVNYIKATENEDVLKGKAKESRGFLKSGPTFPKSVPVVPPSLVGPGERSELSAFTVGCRAKDTVGIWACARLMAQRPSMPGRLLNILWYTDPSHSSFSSLESGSQGLGI